MASAEVPSPLDRLLRLFTDVRAGEGLTALMLAFDVFLLLSSYYVVKSIRDAVILSEASAEWKAYTNAGQVIVLAAVVPLYGMLADRLPRRRLINIVTLAFAIGFIAFTSVSLEGAVVAVMFFVWVSIFGVMIIAQFWSFANDVYTQEEGKRLFPLVAFGASLGGVVGATYARQLIGPMGIGNLIVFGVGILLVQLLVFNYVDSRERRLREADLPLEETTAIKPATRALKVEKAQQLLREFTGAPEPEDDGAQQADRDPPRVGDSDGSVATGRGAFALVLGTPYLLMIGLLTLLLNFVNTQGGYIHDRLVSETAARLAGTGQLPGMTQAEFLTAYFGGFYLIVNLTALLLQLFLVSRVVKYLGVTVALMILPTLAIGAYGLVSWIPVLTYVRWAKTAENATDYSLNNTVRNMLFLPATREQKYKAKQVVDSVGQRAGDTLHALLVLVGTTVFAMTTRAFALVNIGVAVVWLLLAFKIGREYGHLVETGETPR
ncbi:MAG: Npt1/Npt2 family nucleotide transporter [Acidobacteriota bacterium]|jgi:AAA family ATP:ADP antiporter